MEIAKEVPINVQPTLEINTDYIIPDNTYNNIFYYGTGGNITLPSISDCVDGEKISIVNLGTGPLNILAKSPDIIVTTTELLSITISAGFSVSLTCDISNYIWYVIYNLGGQSDLTATNIYTNILSGNPANTAINVLSNINADAKKIIMEPIKIGSNAGLVNQNINGIAIGFDAGKTNQTSRSIAIGHESGMTNQGTTGEGAIAIGYQSGQINQNTKAVAIGYRSGQNNQGSAAIAIGENAGQTAQGAEAIAIGYNAGNLNQGAFAIALGENAGSNTQGANGIAIGTDSAQNNQGDGGIAIGYQAAQNTQGANAIAIGYQAGQNNQGITAIAIGYQAGQTTQGENAIAIGYQAGQITQGQFAIAVGYQAGSNNQASGGIALGYQAGAVSQKEDAIAIGYQAGSNNQAVGCIHIGYQAGTNGPKQYSIGIGNRAGAVNQGQFSIAIGSLAGETNQPDNTTILNSTGTALNGANGNNRFYIKNVRYIDYPGTATLRYEPSLKELITVRNISDQRIKKNIVDLDNNLCINLVENIPVKKFKYVESGDPEYGFIAQDVKQYLPDAINTFTDYVADIWQDAMAIVLPDDRLKINYTNVSIGDKLKINDKNSKNHYFVTVIEKYDDYIITNSAYIKNDMEIKIVGKQVNDRLELNKNMLSVVSWNALKGVLDKVKNLENRLKNYQNI
jgi:hypothetical protein